MDLSREVGLRLLLSPLGSNVVVRTACCSVGTVLPIYSTFKAIERQDQDEQQRWLIYWAVYGSFSVVEVFSDKILSWMPLYYHVKFAFLVWLQLPSNFGAKDLYDSHLRPFLLRRQARLDRIVDYLYAEMSKFVIAHEGEIRLARALFSRLVASVRECIHPVQREPTHAIEGPRRPPSETQSEDEDE